MLSLSLVFLLQVAPPVSGDGALRLPGVTLSLESIWREGADRCAARLEQRLSVEKRVTLRRACGVREEWSTRDDGVEHELFVARSPRGSGALHVRLAAQGPWLERSKAGHVFAGPGANQGWVYGQAFVVSADGRRARIDVLRVDGGLELVVPPALLSFPLHIDPLVFPFTEHQLAMTASLTPRFSDSDEADPTLTWATNGAAFIGAWSDDRRSRFTDLFGAAFVPGGGLTLQNLLEAPGIQRKPALTSTRDGGVIIAFEDWSSLTPELHVVRIPDDMSGSTQRSITGGRTPSLTFDPALGPVLGYAANGTAATVVVVDDFFTGNSNPLWSFAIAGGTIVDTAIASGSGHQAMLVQTATNALVLIKDGTEVPLPQTMLDRTNPTLLMNDAGDLFAAWTAPLANSTVVEHWRKTSGGQGGGQIPNSFSPSLSVFDNRLTVAAFTGTDAGGRLFTLNDINSAQQYAAFSLARSQNLGDLTTEVRGGMLAAGWTNFAPLEQHNVEFALFTALDGGGYGAQYFPIQSRVAQRDVRVSYLGGDVGIAVWREGGDVLRARWLDSNGDPNLGFPGAFPLATAEAGERFDGLDVALGRDDAFVAVRVVMADGSQVIRSSYVQRLSSTRRDGPSFTFPQTATTLPPRVAWDGSNFRIGVLNALGFEVSVANGNSTSMSKVVAGRAAVNFDLDCLVGTSSCAVVFWQPLSGDVVLVDVEDNTNSHRVESSLGPVSLTNDGQQYVIAYVSAVSINQVQTPALGLATAPERGAAVVDSRRIPLVDEQGDPIPLENIDVVGTAPLVVAVEETLRSRTWLVDVSMQAPWPYVFDAINPRAVAISPGAKQGVVAFERFTPSFFSQAWIIPFTVDDLVRTDAGVDGGLDAGPGTDAGVDGGGGAIDAGLNGPDGGVDPLALTSTGCGCSSSSGSTWWLLAFALLALVSRRRNVSTLAVVLLVASPAFAQLVQVDEKLLSDARGSDRLSNDAHSPTVAVNDAGVAMVVWVDTRRGHDDLFMARTDGTTIPFGRPLVLNFQPQSRPALLAAGDDFLLAWQEGTLRGPEVHLLKLNGQTLDVLAQQVRPEARAPSLTEDQGRWWIAFQATDGATGQLVLQPVDDFFSAGPTSNTFVIQGVDAGVMRTAISVNGGYNVIAAETADDLLFFNKGQLANVRGQLTAPASTPLRNAAVHTGPGSNDAWLAVEQDGAAEVDLLHYTSPNDLFPTVRTFLMRETPAFARLKTAVVLTTFDRQNTPRLHLDDIALAGTQFQVPMVFAVSPTQLQSATVDLTTWFTWTNGAAPDRDISLVKLNNPFGTTALTDVSPQARIAQSDVHVSFQGGRGVAAWRYGKTTTFVTWIGHASGSDTVTLSGIPIALQNDVGSELIDLDVAMGDTGALVLRRSKTFNGDVVDVTWISRIDGSIHPAFSDSADLPPQVLFDGARFRGSLVSGELLSTTTVDLDGGPGDVAFMMLGRPPQSFDVDCLPAPKDICLVIFDSASGPAWAMTEQTAPLDLTGTGPVAVANDGRSFHLLWAALLQQRVAHATVTPPDKTLMLESVLNAPGQVVELRAASARPPWVATVDSTSGLGVTRLGAPGFIALDSGRGVDIAELEDGLAVLGFTAFDDTSAAMLPHVVVVRDLAADGGTTERDGGMDGGPIDETDGGSSGKTDGGTTAPLSLFSTSCGCSEGSVLAWVLGALLLRRRH